MDPGYLHHLRRLYVHSISDEIDPLAAALRRKRDQPRVRLIDLAATASSLAYDDRESLDPLAVQAISDTNPTFDPDRIGSYGEEEWLGILNSAKGKYFEYLVVDRLNDGEVVGDLYLRDGETAAVAESMNQPGWDVRITDTNGVEVELVQLKASESAGYLQAALERYPDIKILTTDEVANGLHDSMVLDSNIKDSDLLEAIDSTLDDMSQSLVEEFWSAFNPLLPLIVIAGTEGYKVAMGRQALREGLISSSNRGGAALVSGGVGAAVKVLFGTFWLAAPAAIFTRFWYDGRVRLDGIAAQARSESKKLSSRAAYWQAMP